MDHVSRSLSPPHPAVQRVEAHPVNQLGRAVDIPDREIAIFAGLERRSREYPARARTQRHAGEAFGNRHPEQRRAHVHGQRSDVSGELPGLQSVASAMFTPWARNSSIGGFLVSRMK